jgi:hypothetical protein
MLIMAFRTLLRNTRISDDEDRKGKAQDVVERDWT